MDAALALWQINPRMEYGLSDDGQTILSWRGPGEQPTPEQLQAAWTAYQEMCATWETYKAAHDLTDTTIHQAFTRLGLPDHPDSAAQLFATDESET